jgi:hypothetical protein
MSDDEYEPNRVLGMPWRTGPQARQGVPHARQGVEPQRVMGFPVDWFGAVDRGWFWSMAHPVRAYRRWLRRRRLGPYAIDEDRPRPRR